jgi:hypothetical protein
MSHWDTRHPIRTVDANRASNLANHILGNKFKGINDDVGRVFSLYNFLVNHRHVPASKLREQITENGKPLFSTADLESIQQTIASHMNTPYVRQLQSGGAHSLDADPSRSKFWDRAIRKIMHPVTKRIPPSWDGILWYTFILYSLEQNSLIGPFLSTALDTITLSLPVLAELVSGAATELISLVPIPYAGKLGGVIGYVFSLIFVFFAVFMNMSRKHFGSAFKVSLEAVPILGDVLAEGSQMFETGAERYLQNRGRILKAVGTVSPTAERIANYYSPSNSIVEEAPSLDPAVVLPAIKKEVIHYGLESAGLENIVIPNNLPTPEQLERLSGNGSAKPNESESAKPNGTGSNGNGSAANSAPKKGGTRRKRCRVKQTRKK